MTRPPIAKRAPPALGRLLTHATGRVQRLAQRHLDAEGVKLAQWALLFGLSLRSPATQAELAAFTDRTEAAASLTLGEMEEAGLVRRESNPENRRQTLVSMTPAGRALFEKTKGMWPAVNKLAFKGLTREEAEGLIRLLGRVIDNMDRELEAGGGAQAG